MRNMEAEQLRTYHLLTVRKRRTKSRAGRAQNVSKGDRKPDTFIVLLKFVKADGGKGRTHFTSVNEVIMQTMES